MRKAGQKVHILPRIHTHWHLKRHPRKCFNALYNG
ncbi:hypothetical protein DVUA0107 (plasmid) [Nitratidesulfovibrio vulgaris str. Hildenborough]|uniref:Uncharacterized protein n=1 Tax=Nitratidesulfovibrio vulgaris (strain ATCC 29579 / DSM 644 / CCUG 34227 / NCIMB 8303 / VKM B-1760 / Hildenborough) TaxID=882 RepID=Q72WI2_NITV2|nr:hypothetical protein DVUA0107 [Nitratidesulfovibrio vulgaris str. Hildenborough]